MEGMYWFGIEEEAEKICKQYGYRALKAIDGGKKLVADQIERSLNSDLTGWSREIGSNLIELEVSKI